MKGSERHRLKENELSLMLADFSSRLSEKRSTVGVVAGVVLLAILAGGGYWAYRTRAENRAQLLFSDAMAIVQTPVQEGTTGSDSGAKTYPSVNARAEAALAKFMEVADAYPSSQQGIAARYYAAASLALLGRHAEAAARFQEVIDRAGANSFYGRVAQLGAVQSNAQAKQFDRAIGAAQTLVDTTPEDVMPRDALLMELGRVQMAAGKKTEAKQTFDKVIADFPDSPYLEEAKQLISELT